MEVGAVVTRQGQALETREGPQVAAGEGAARDLERWNSDVKSNA